MKRKKLTKRIFATLLFTVAMVVGMSMPAWAADTNPATPTTQVKVDVEKILTLGASKALPLTDKFEFKAEPFSYTPADSNDTVVYGSLTSDQTTMFPKITVNGIENTEGNTSLDGFSQNSTPTPTISEDLGSIFAGGTAALNGKIGAYKTTSDTEEFVFNINTADGGGKTVTKPGVYTYKITEQVPASSEVSLIYDRKEYYVNIYVINQTYTNIQTGDTFIEGEPTGSYTIGSVTVWQNATGTLTAATDEDNNNQPPVSNNQYIAGADVAGKDSLTTAQGAGSPIETTVTFVNDYQTKDLTISKQVTGNYASTDKYFRYQVTITEDGSEAGKLKNYKVDYNDATAPDAVPTIDNIYYDTSDAGGGAHIGTATGSPLNAHNPEKITGDVVGTTGPQYVYLKHNQSITIKGLPANAKWQLMEAGVEGYEASYVQTATEATQDSDKEVSESGPLAPGTSLDTSAKTMYYNDTSGGGAPVSKLSDMSVAFTNDRNYTTPTGLILHYMPYVLAIVLVLAAAFFFMTKKKTNRSYGEGL